MYKKWKIIVGILKASDTTKRLSTVELVNVATTRL